MSGIERYLNINSFSQNVSTETISVAKSLQRYVGMGKNTNLDFRIVEKSIRIYLNIF